MNDVENHVLDELKDWLKSGSEDIQEIHRSSDHKMVHLKTNKHEYIYYPDTNSLLVEIKTKAVEYQPVLYPNRAVETSLW
ncbi:hypothetical protein [Companilactobacillus nantensis]|uniref:Uncharacterized protein n=1 Tax=Companilactobacillus nantensis DSM 16982 TaxID=1423774 RepID=A0A0R1WKQ8_9LACO|nr:hypothetical protein [Companilactobacillus nantensis]KRM18448.1 hypothetical protein FD31_GL000995 [Companilactobacillus nantensis DSM 16982]GEO63018.1 hypothetical protein LNA01_02010 [Companilactobacillus nantensis]